MTNHRAQAKVAEEEDAVPITDEAPNAIVFFFKLLTIVRESKPGIGLEPRTGTDTNTTTKTLQLRALQLHYG